MKEGNELHGVDQGLNTFSSELHWLSLSVSDRLSTGTYYQPQ